MKRFAAQASLWLGIKKQSRALLSLFFLLGRDIQSPYNPVVTDARLTTHNLPKTQNIVNYAMPLPPPPPSDRRFISFLTEEGQRAVREQSGQLYELIVQSLLEANPDCFDSREEIEEVLPLFLWPPSPIESICDDFPHIPIFPTHIRLSEHHEVIVVVCDPQEYLKLLYQRTRIKAHFKKVWGGDSNSMTKLRDMLIADGSTSAIFEKVICESIVVMENNPPLTQTERPWWKFW